MANRLRLWKGGLAPGTDGEAIMAPIARALSERQIEDVSAYFTPRSAPQRLYRPDEAPARRFAGRPARCGLAGCGTDVQSVMAPRGTQAGQIADAGLDAVRARRGRACRSSSWRHGSRSAARRESARRLRSERSIVALGLVFPAVTLTLLLGYGVFLMRAQLSPPTRATRSASRSPASNGGGASAMPAPRRSRAPTRSAFRSGVRCEFTLKAADVIHSFWVPSLGGKVDMIPGRTTRLRLTAERPGIYRGQCAEYCGGPHALMALRGHRHAACRIRRVARARGGAGARAVERAASGAGNRCSARPAAAPATRCAAPRRPARSAPT